MDARQRELGRRLRRNPMRWRCISFASMNNRPFCPYPRLPNLGSEKAVFFKRDYVAGDMPQNGLSAELGRKL